MRNSGSLADPGTRHKPHLHSKWVSDLVRHPRVLDAVESILGPDLLIWRSVFFVKLARDPHYIAWHQDSAYWGLSTDDEVTAWIALTESTAANGCLQVVPGSHRQPAVPHALQFSEDNLLVRGQKALVDVAESDARRLELRPGEMSLHHVRMLHGSDGKRVRRPPRRSRGPLHLDARAPARMAKLGDARARRGLGSATSTSSPSRAATTTRKPSRGTAGPAGATRSRCSRRLSCGRFRRTLGMLIRWLLHPARVRPGDEVAVAPVRREAEGKRGQAVSGRIFSIASAKRPTASRSDAR